MMSRNCGRALLLLLISFFVTACNQQVVNKSANNIHTTRPATTTSTTISSTNKPSNKQSNKYQLGIDIYWTDKSSASPRLISQQANLIMQYIVSLDANAIDISFPFYDPGGLTGSKVSKESTTPTPVQLKEVINIAQQYNLRVSIRPLMDESNLGNGWRGVIQPTNINQWFMSYTQFLIPYLKVAESTHVRTFIVGAELNSIQNQHGWQNAIQTFRSLYSGQLAYSDNFNMFDNAQFGPLVNTIGLDAYFPINIPAKAPIQGIVAGWKKYLNPIAKKISMSKVVIDEVGISAQNGAYKTPYDYTLGNSKPINKNIQINWFSAACQIFHDYNMKGIYFWDVTLNQNPYGSNPNNDSPMSFINRGDVSIRQCFVDTQN